jgi:pSer/pThr/pTyr-binding forkhead associated (FHA) protein
MEVTLNIYSSGDVQQVPMTSDRLTIGRGSTSNVPLNDEGLSRLHVSIHRDGDRVWILDEGSTNGSKVNGISVPPVGTPLNDGDEIFIGNHTTIVISFVSASEVIPTAEADQFYAESPATESNAPDSGLPWSLKLSLLFAAVVILIAGVALAARSFGVGSSHKTSREDNTSLPVLTETPIPSGSVTGGFAQIVFANESG